MPDKGLFAGVDSTVKLKDLTGPDPVIRELLPKQLRDIVYVNRRSSRIQKIRQYFIKLTNIDNLSDSSATEAWEELVQINRFLTVLLLVNSKKKDSEEDDAHVLLYHANAPEILLRMIYNAHPFGKNPKYYTLIFLGIEVLTTFMHPKSLTYRHVTDKIFHDSREEIDNMVELLEGRHTWLDKLAVLHFFGVACLSPPGVYFVQTHLQAFKELCVLMYRSTAIAEEKIEGGFVTLPQENVAATLKTFKSDCDITQSARLFSRVAMHHAVVVFRQTVLASIKDPHLYFKIVKVVEEAKVLEHFSYIVKQLMIWIEPGQYLNRFLEGIRYCFILPNAIEVLFLNDIEANKESKLPLGVDTFKYWKHESRFPLRLTWLLTHAFALRDDMGSGWCIILIRDMLRNGNWKDVEKLILNCGSELMDLAHLLDIETPEKINVQCVILEALLRYGGFSYYEFGKGAYHEGVVKQPTDLPSFCLEAALYSKKAQCEMKMPVGEKQKRIIMADLEKDKGNVAFKAGKFNEAVMRYTDAIAICPLAARTKQSIYYSNRAESYLRANEPRRAIHDCNRALCLDLSSRLKVQWRRSRAFQKLNLDYPAWLDMKCIKSDWNIPAEKSGVDFRQLLSSLTSQVGILKRSLFNEVEKKVWTTNAL